VWTVREKTEREAGGDPANPDAGELVVDLDVPVDIDADAIEALEEETRRIVFNILFVAFTIAVVIVVLSVR
jgi:hypothetical protein